MSLKVAGSRRREGEQAVLRRPRPGRGEGFRQQARPVRSPVHPGQAGTLYRRRALAKDVGVAPDGTGSHRIVIGSNTGAFADPDGFAWATATV
jgi:hypothetical protein